MARYSETAKGMKLEDGDIVRNIFDTTGKVLQVLVMVPDLITVDGQLVKARTDVLLTVDYTRGTGEPNIACLEEIKAVRKDGEWFNLKGEQLS